MTYKERTEAQRQAAAARVDSHADGRRERIATLNEPDGLLKLSGWEGLKETGRPFI